MFNPELKKDIFTVYDELTKLTNYYQAEIKQTEIALEKVKSEVDKAFYKGALRAYHDHFAEVHWIADVLRGWKNDMEAK